MHRPSVPSASGTGAFLRDNAPWLAAGAGMAFGSSLGQTFFIPLFAGEIRAEFGLSHGAWGGISMLGTLASAAAMLVVGQIADRVAPRRLAMAALGLLALVCLAMAALPVWWLLPVAVFGLRFFGQGMLPHVALVAVGRWFRATRGRAVSVVNAGHAFGEAVLPLPFVLLIGWAGWRAGWGAAALLAVAMIPVLARLLRRDRVPAGQAGGAEQAGLGGRHWSRREMLGHWLFWAVLPAIFAHPVFGTALFFQHVHVAEVKGWRLEGLVALFPVHVAFSLGGLAAAGALADRFGTARLLPLIFVPMAAGFAVFGAAEGLGGAAMGFALLGLAHGGSAVAAGAFWPEQYGTRHLGAIRGVIVATMVFATALGPWITGVLIDAGVGIERQFLAMAAHAAAMAGLVALAMARLRRARLAGGAG